MTRLYALLIVVGLSGCMVIDAGVETTKTIWGSSTRKLEQGRNNAITKTYDKSYWDVVKASHDIAAKYYTIFKEDAVKGYMVIMGIKGAVDTTEVGVFFVELADNQTRIEITSLSTNAKRLVSKNLFHQLDIAFELVPPDPEEPIEIQEEPVKK
jgi:hypothetical protein